RAARAHADGEVIALVAQDPRRLEHALTCRLADFGRIGEGPRRGGFAHPRAPRHIHDGLPATPPQTHTSPNGRPLGARFRERYRGWGSVSIPSRIQVKSCP